MSIKLQNPYAVEWSRFANGERMPFLVRVDTGVPIEAPTFWSLAARRAQNLQANTLKNELRSLMYLYLWADLRGVDLLGRLYEGTFFSLTEILDIVNVAGRFLDDVLAEIETKGIIVKRRFGAGIQAQERRNRLAAAYSFINFTSSDILSQLAPWPNRWDRYYAAKSECLDLLRAHVQAAGKGRRNADGAPEGLAEAALVKLREVVVPDHSDNPFRPGVRVRNYLIVRLLLDLGIRRGELLGIKVTDCSLGSTGTITIHRRPSDPEDPGSEKPETKTEARPLLLSGRLTELLHEYIVHHRAKIPGARKHPYLLVSNLDGAPLSISSINKIFDALRQRVPGLPAALSPHLMRHSWNDAFSDLMDRKGIAPEVETKWRARLMGWRNESSAEHYLRRTVRRRSNEILQEMQSGLIIGKAKDENAS